jgi:autophagy-related protein 18
VRLNRKRLVVVLEDEIYLYDILNMAWIHTMSTSPNPNAICALSPSSEKCFIAYPFPKPREGGGDKRPSHAPPLSSYVPPTSGQVLIFDTLSLKPVNVIEAHRSPLCCIAMSYDGSLLATASETGTIIRVFAVPSGQKLYQFRRGTYHSTIYNMSFNQSSTFLCVSSTSDTVHIFRLGAPPESSSVAAVPVPSSSHQDRWSRSYSHDNAEISPSRSNTGSPGSEVTDMSIANLNSSNDHAGQGASLSTMLRRSSQIMGRSVAGVVGSYLPQTMTQMWERVRDFAYIKIPDTSHAGSPRASGSALTLVGGSTGLRSVVAMSNDSPKVMVVTSDGTFSIFSIDLVQGGKGELVRQFS